MGTLLDPETLIQEYQGIKCGLSNVRRAEVGKSVKWVIDYICTSCDGVFTTAYHDALSANTSECTVCANKTKQLEKLYTRLENYTGPLKDLKFIGYSERYNKRKALLEYTCPVCGKRRQTEAKSIFAGSKKCKHCNNFQTRNNPTEPTLLYYVYFPKHDLYKIGITTKTVKERLAGEEFILLYEYKYDDGFEASEMESLILSAYDTYRYRGLKVLRYGGNTELFIKDVLWWMR